MALDNHNLHYVQCDNDDDDVDSEDDDGESYMYYVIDHICHIYVYYPGFTGWKPLG